MKKTNMTGKKSSVTGKFNFLPVTMTARLPRFISRLAIYTRGKPDDVINANYRIT